MGSLLSTTSKAQESLPSKKNVEESKVLSKTSTYVIRKIVIDGEVFVTKVHTGGREEGQVSYARVGADDAIAFAEEEGRNTDSSVEVRSATTTLQQSGSIGIKRAKNLGGSLGYGCDADFCTTHTYTHQYGGVTFELTKLASAVSHAALAGLLASILATYTVYEATAGVVGFLTDTLVNLTSTKKFTFIPVDVDREQWWGAGDLKPKVKNKVGNDWDMHRWDCNTFYTGDKHLGFLNENCG
jgi:hypothetical protein